jgi:NhaA family Na+:H+ antiporter
MTPLKTGKLVHAVFDRYLLLPLGAIIALVWANTAAESYFSFSIPLRFFTNEIAMAIFLGLVAQEIMDATVPGGALHTWRRWTLPLVAAAGGVAGAALTYLAYVNLKHETVLQMGWPVATAVDIAATYVLMKVLFKRNSAVYPFLLLTAVATNAFALTVIGMRHYVVETHSSALLLLLGSIGLAATLRMQHVRAFWPYLAVCAPLSWLAFYWGGLHPALALLPIVPFLPHRPRGIDVLDDPAAPPVDHTRRIEHEWALVVQPLLFLYGLVNSGVVLNAYDTGSWAVLTAALVGRPVGMAVAVGFAVGAGLHLPRSLGWRELLVIGMTVSTGFTLAIFAATAVFPIGPLLAQMKVGALLSVVGAALALALARVLHVGRFARHHRPAVSGTHHVRVRHAHGHA